MKTIRTWKDEEYRLSLSETELANLPENPAGLIDLTDVQIASIGGAGGSKKNGGSTIVNNVVPIVPSSYGGYGTILPITITNITGSGTSG